MAQDLLFFPDHGADPVWDQATGGMVDLDGLPISAATRDAIRAWAARWERWAWQQMQAEDVANGMLLGPAEPIQDGAAEAIAEEGHECCRRLRHELGAGWRVGWVAIEGGVRDVEWGLPAPPPDA